MWALKLLLLLGLVYGALLAAFYFAQTALIFPARMVREAGPLTGGAEPLVLDVSEGNRLQGLHIAPRFTREQRPVILGFAGNAWNAQDAAAYLHDLYPDADIVAFHYRGYRPSTGKPGAAALLGDAIRIYDFVARRFGGRPVVAVGFSIGTGVASHLAGRRRLAGAILVTPFDSLAAVGRGHYPWLPVGLFLRHRMNPADELRHSGVPTALIVAERDSLIPPVRAQALAASVRKLVFNRTIPAARHNDIYQFPAFRQAMADALAAIETARRPRP
jgi:hypothetical protein